MRRPMSEPAELAVLEGLRAKALPIPMDLAARRRWAEGFNEFLRAGHFGARLDLEDETVARLSIDRIEAHHLGGMGTSVVNGMIIAGLFDAALGVAGLVQFPGRRAGTVDLSIKLMRPSRGPITVYAVATKANDRLAFAQSELFSDGEYCATASGMVAVSGRAAASPEDGAGV